MTPSTPQNAMYLIAIGYDALGHARARSHDRASSQWRRCTRGQADNRADAGVKRGAIERVTTSAIAPCFNRTGCFGRIGMYHCRMLSASTPAPEPDPEATDAGSTPDAEGDIPRKNAHPVRLHVTCSPRTLDVLQEIQRQLREGGHESPWDPFTPSDLVSIMADVVASRLGGRGVDWHRVMKGRKRKSRGRK